MPWKTASIPEILGALLSGEHTSQHNGLYGGQLPPCRNFLLALLAGLAADRWLGPGGPALGSPPLLWGCCQRLVGLASLITFGSLKGQLLALGGSRGLYPARVLLARAAADVPPPWRYLRFPAGHLWLCASDASLLLSCWAGIALSAYACWGGEYTGAALLGCWGLLVSTCTVMPLLQYPWDCLLMETLLLCGLLLPSPPAEPSDSGSLLMRLLLVRLMLGMAKFKFSRGWAHQANVLFLKWFLCWQPLPAELAYWLFHWIPPIGFELLYRLMYIVEVMLPALFLCSSHWLRVPAALCTIGLQFAIAIQGNYGIFNLLTAALALPLLAGDPVAAPEAGWAEWACAVLLGGLGLFALPHNSYTTNAWCAVCLNGG